MNKWGVRLSALFIADSGGPFNITVGHDLYGTTLFNARPGIATDPSKPGLVSTAYGLLDPNPVAGETVLPRNYGRGPDIIMLNLRIKKVFAFGPPVRGRFQQVEAGAHRVAPSAPGLRDVVPLLQGVGTTWRSHYPHATF